jgi:hypothetical protein
MVSNNQGIDVRRGGLFKTKAMKREIIFELVISYEFDVLQF